MKHNFKTMILMSTLAVCLSACTDNDNKSAHDGVQITANDKMDASSLADAGEQLVSPYTWMLADKVFTMALEKNATNEKAQFYRALLKPMMLPKSRAKGFKRLPIPL